MSKQKLELTWIGKDKQPVLEPRILIEDPEKSFGDKTAENMLIFGDNLLALKALEQDFAGKIKCIYIDPPFNTGSAFDYYDDSVEYSVWLTLMRDRLCLLQKLLSSDPSTLPELNREVKSVNELTKSEIKEIAVEKIKQAIFNSPQQALFAGHMIQEVEKVYEKLVDEFTRNIIEIPRITIQQNEDIRSGFKDFDLDAKKLNLLPGSEQIIVMKLTDGKIEVVEPTGRKIKYDSLENIIVSELINFPEVDYDSNADLLFKLSRQAIEKVKTYLDEDGTSNVITNYKQDIGRFIYIQLMEHFYCEAPTFEKPIVKPFTKIEDHNFSKYTMDSIHHYTETIMPTNAIPSKVFSGFNKACHALYKFDSKTEKDFAHILEQDKGVLKWLRPAPNQLHIYWKHNSRQYHPDFVAETADAIYMIETKKEGDIDTTEVQEKSQAALTYCMHANEFTAQNGGKPWKYIPIPHDVVKLNMGFDTLVKRYEYKDD